MSAHRPIPLPADEACPNCDGVGTVTIRCESSFGPNALSDYFETDCNDCRGSGVERVQFVPVEHLPDGRIVA